jgi:hypothetical protein
MCELPPKYGRKNKVRVLRYLVDPQFRYLGAQRPVKRGINFHQFQVLRQILQWMKAARLDRGINHGIPIGMQPAGCSAAKSALHDKQNLLIRLLFAFYSIAIRSPESTGFFLGEFEERNIQAKGVVLQCISPLRQRAHTPLSPKRARYFFTANLRTTL